MILWVQTIYREIKTLHENNIRLQAIGNLESLPEITYRELTEAIEQTSDHDRMTLTLALSYSSRWEITRAAQNLSKDVASGSVKPEEVDQNLFQSYLVTTTIPDPELLIRTSGEFRISNFLLWQIAYSELYFTPKFWPDFRKEDLYEAIVDFQNRERRFGKTSEQISK